MDKKMSDCLEVCTKSTGCIITENGGTHKICNNKLNKNFE